MTARPLPFWANNPVFNKFFGRRAAHGDDLRAVKRRLRIELADLPDYLKKDIGLDDD